MPWKECSVMDERLRFVAKLLDGEAMTDVCREFGISRKTGKIFARHTAAIRSRTAATSAFAQEFVAEGPHDALTMRTLAEIYSVASTPAPLPAAVQIDVGHLS